MWRCVATAGAVQPPLLKPPNAYAFAIDEFVRCKCIDDGIGVDGTLPGAGHLPIPRRRAGAALIVTDDVDAVEHEVRDEKSHLARFGIVAVNEHDRCAFAIVRMIK